MIRGRQWGWSTVMETARRYDLNPAALLSAGIPVPHVPVIEPDPDARL